MKNRDIRGLFEGGSDRLTSLRTRSRARSLILHQVLAALPAELAQAVLTAGLEEGRLTLGVDGAVWANRIRYVTEALRAQMTESMGIEIRSVRIKVVQRPA